MFPLTQGTDSLSASPHFTSEKSASERTESGQCAHLGLTGLWQDLWNWLDVFREAPLLPASLTTTQSHLRLCFPEGELSSYRRPRLAHLDSLCLGFILLISLFPQRPMARAFPCPLFLPVLPELS